MDADARALVQTADEVTHRVQELRMAPFAEFCATLPRQVRDLAAAAGKKVRLRIEGRDVRAEREVWRAAAQALLHLVRNAVDHGIEPPAAREAAGKLAVGTLTITAEIRAGGLLITVADDGAGFDAVALRRRLEARGDAVPETDAELARTLFRGGISARAEPGLISGRGVGLDSARAAVEGVRGSVDVSWIPGAGTTFRVSCPITLTQVSAVLVRSGEQLFAVPATDIECMARVRPSELQRSGGKLLVGTPTGPVPVVSLSSVAGGADPAPRDAGAIHVVLLRAGGRALAVAVDQLVEAQTLLARPLRGVRNPPPYASSAALLASGQVAVVLNAAAVIEAGWRQAAAPTSLLPPPPGHRPRPRVLVVDDSITTRTLQAGIIEAAGYEVVAAGDGDAAWRILEDQPVQVVVSDVEMPGMDGFALCRMIRASGRHRDVPVVLVTALESPADRDRGLEAGADAYIAKSSFDQRELLSFIEQRVGRAG